MKCFDIIASKEVVATFTMDYSTYTMKFKCSSKLVEFIREKHPEYANVPYHVDFPDDTIVVEFYSIGNLVIGQVGEK